MRKASDQRLELPGRTGLGNLLSGCLMSQLLAPDVDSGHRIYYTAAAEALNAFIEGMGFLTRDAGIVSNG